MTEISQEFLTEADIYEGYDDEKPDSVNVRLFGPLLEVPELPPLLHGPNGKLVKKLESGAELYQTTEGEYPWSSYVVITEIKDGKTISSKSFATEINPSGELDVDYYIRTKK
jgi:hypothetical protein